MTHAYYLFPYLGIYGIQTIGMVQLLKRTTNNLSSKYSNVL